MKQNKEFKNEALAALRGNWAPSVLATIVYFLSFLVVVGFAILPITAFHPEAINEASTKVDGSVIWMYVVVFLVAGPMAIGIYNAFKMLLSGDADVTRNMFKTGFGNYFHNVWGYFLMELFIGLWTLLLIIPGIIKYFSYAMTPFILKDYPELSANKAIDLSRAMMKDRKFDLFYLILSFIGWYLLAILTFGIGFFWLVPYVQTSMASFYADVKGDYFARKELEASAAAAPAAAAPEQTTVPTPAPARKEENPEDYMPKQ